MIWKRIKGFFGEEDEAEAAEERAEASAATEAAKERAAREAERPKTTEEKLFALTEQATPPDASFAVQLLDAMRREGRGARGLDLARKLLERHAEAPLEMLALRVAEALSARGDDDAAWEELQPLLEGIDAPLPACLLAAEIAERRGDEEGALALYERILARDLDFPRARERAARLRDRGDAKRDLAGATIATDGALARGRYRVEKELGRGGAGTVFSAYDLRLDRRVALKVYHRRGRVERERLLVEAQTPAGIEHPGVVRIFDLDPRLGAIAMEWVVGGSVRVELGRGAVPAERARRWIATALEALAFVHGRGVVHRDLKPSNFLLREDDRVVLTDFGLAVKKGV
ncbi:MAG TPA: serine/threonine-protein kinase, partial [Polyangiaceae bacterium LLY-WYZ-15_(1-7)]|nr:serine/threonine-protein kinase [Polyangiaceae bacterium LLY-WYZ-15_(1-7)]